MMQLSPSDRQALDAELAALDAAEHHVARMLKPFFAVQEGIAEARALALARYGIADVAGRCTTCGLYLFPGEQGHRARDNSDIVWCANHAPTYADLKRQAEGGQSLCEGDPVTDAEVLSAVEAHLADGGTLADPVLHEL